MSERRTSFNKEGAGVWVAYFSDWSSMVPFPTEVEALRHAVANSMRVTEVPFGTCLHDVVAGTTSVRRELALDPLRARQAANNLRRRGFVTDHRTRCLMEEAAAFLMAAADEAEREQRST